MLPKTRLENAEKRLGPPPSIEDRLRAHLAMRWVGTPRLALQARVAVKAWEVMNHPECPPELRDMLRQRIANMRKAFTFEHNRRPPDPRIEAYAEEIDYAARIYAALGIPIETEEE
ncbi:hypothetical protein Mal4_35560 [Maioricimonas rarisocia]|uniref:Uncharacterized protein n=1 Tax=Maioricimonas rarisocia TaxID=2528026 RepID=A0A517Z9Y2_9PLAN|nr:hypothetical protein [Maioricimonas rarisocia]QDU39219.1 hypothetical protein Mal4_35560 [Maioricimonas rarisocia]